MHQAFIQYLTQTCRCSPDNKYLLAISGGIDSVVMAHLFHALGFNFALAHCNFRLRGEESDGDQRFVEDLAVRLNRPLFVKDFDTLSFAQNRGISVQMAARDLRYGWFDELAGQHHLDYIATGHNRNDVVETVLLNFARGTGIRGLSGISPRHGRIIRPMLFASRDDILQYTRDHNLSWREDSSNRETKYHRNKIRHTIIPALQTINPAFMQCAMDTVHRLAQTETLLDVVLSQVKQNVCTSLPDRDLISVEKLQEYAAIELLLYELLKGYGFGPGQMQTIIKSFESNPGKQFQTRTHVLTRDRKYLIITPNKKPVTDEIWIEQHTVMISFPVQLRLEIFENTADYPIPAASRFAAIDADKVSFPLKLRHWKPGDRFRPLGMAGSKKISDFLINRKIALPDKEQVWILESAGKIIWVVNHRIDDRFRVTEETRNMLLVEYAEY